MEISFITIAVLSQISSFIFQLLKDFFYPKYWNIVCVLKDGFVNNTTLNNHVKAKHSDEKPYVCEHCPARYATSMSLSTHRSRVHRVNKAGKFGPLDQLPNYLRVWYCVITMMSRCTPACLRGSCMFIACLAYLAVHLIKPESARFSCLAELLVNF